MSHISWAQNTPAIMGESSQPDIINMTITPVSQITNEVVLRTTGFFFFAQKNPLSFMMLVLIIAGAVIIFLRKSKNEKTAESLKQESSKNVPKIESSEIVKNVEKEIAETIDAAQNKTD